MCKWLSASLLGFSLVLCLALWACYLIRSEHCAALTLWPAWFWVGPGLVLTVLARRGGLWPTAVICGPWVVFLVTCAEEPKVLLTALRRWPNPEWQRARAQGKAIRVISLNCAGGSEQAAAEVLKYQPDIVLLQ